MAKPSAAKRLKKADKAKVKLKGYATKFLPKGKNITDTSFKVRKIVLQEQIKTPTIGEALTRKKLSIKEVLSRLQHYSSVQRLEGLAGITELLSHMDKKQLTVHLSSIVDNLGRLSSDAESRVRRTAARVLTGLLAQVDEVELSPFSSILGSYLSCAMTHIQPGVLEDSLLILDALLVHAPFVIANSSNQLLACSLDMISRLRNEKGTDRQLSLNLASTKTSTSWRASVLGRLQALLQVSLDHESKDNSMTKEAKSLTLTSDTLTQSHIAIYSPHYSRSACLNHVFHHSSPKNSQLVGEATQLQNYTKSLVPLLLASWLEVSPYTSKTTKQIRKDIGLPLESAIVLHGVGEVLYLLWQHLILRDQKSGFRELAEWFIATYQKDLHQYLAVGFPYFAQTGFESDSEEEVEGRRQNKHLNRSVNDDALKLLNLATPHVSQSMKDGHACGAVMKCVPQNLRLCYIFATVLKSPSNILKEKMLHFLTSCINEWDAACVAWNDHLVLALKTVLACSRFWSYNIDSLLAAIYERYKRSASKRSQTHRSFSQHLGKILGNIALSPNFPHLKQNESLYSWLHELPASLNPSRLSVETLKMLNQLARQRNEKFLEGLRAAVPSLLELLKSMPVGYFDKPSEESLGLLSLLYWVPSWSEKQVSALGEMVLNNQYSLSLTRSIVNILYLRQEACPCFKDAPWWNEAISLIAQRSHI